MALAQPGCFVCRKHRDRGTLMPAGPVAEDDLVVVSHIVTPDALSREGTTAHLRHLFVEPRTYLAVAGHLASVRPSKST